MGHSRAKNAKKLQRKINKKKYGKRKKAPGAIEIF